MRNFMNSNGSASRFHKAYSQGIPFGCGLLSKERLIVGNRTEIIGGIPADGISVENALWNCTGWIQKANGG